MNPEVQQMYESMKAKLARLVPDPELRIKAELAVEINALKLHRNAVILGHKVYTECSGTLLALGAGEVQVKRLAKHVDVLLQPAREAEGLVLPDFPQWYTLELADHGASPRRVIVNGTL